MKIINYSLDVNALDPRSALAKRLLGFGDSLDSLVVLVPSRQDEKKELDNKVSVIGVGGVNKVVQLFKLFIVGRRIARQEKYSLVTVQDAYFLCLVAFLLSRVAKIGFEVQIHGLEKFNGIRKILAKALVKRADSIRTVSQRFKKMLVNEFAVKPELITVVPVYTDVSEKTNLDKPTKDQAEFIFLTIGRLVPIKNIGLQIRSMAEVIKIHPQVKLMIVGDGPERDRIQAMIDQSGLSEIITMTGWQDDTDKFYRMADAFLLSSDSEGWGMVAIEAASFGLPIIMTDVGCAGEVIKDGVSGLIIPTGDLARLTNEMKHLIESPELAAKLKTGARQAIQDLPKEDEIIQRYLESWNRADGAGKKRAKKI